MSLSARATLNQWLVRAVAASLVLLGAAPVRAQVDKKEAREREAEAVLRSIAWEKGPTRSSVGDQGELQVPDGYVFTGGPGTRKMLRLMQNPTSGTELGLLAPVNLGWFLIFEFSSIGYVKDADKEKLDPDDILESIRRGTEESNKERKANNWPTITIVGWQTAPFFDSATKNLQWCIKGSSAGHEIVNYNTRVLGRHGVMSANLLVAPDKLDASLPTVKNLIAGFSFKEGKRYSEYKKGDRIAEYGLAALVVGGAAAAAAKLGFFGKLFAMLGKLWKLVVVGLVALAGGLKALLGFRKKSTPVPPGGAGGTGGEGEGSA